jgi:cytochrome b subunit of formate dehydrogenase
LCKRRATQLSLGARRNHLELRCRSCALTDQPCRRSIIGHIYLGTAAEPGTFASMVRGTVTKDWARLHHPKWYREVTGNGRGR